MPPTDKHRRETEREVQKLEEMVDSFAREMKQKLISKVYDGYRGWDELANKRILEKKLMQHIMLLIKGYDQHVDVANLAAFLWYLKQKEVEEYHEQRKDKETGSAGPQRPAHEGDRPG